MDNIQKQNDNSTASQQVRDFVATLPTITNQVQSIIFNTNVELVIKATETIAFGNVQISTALTVLEIVHALCLDDISEIFVGVQPMTSPVGVVDALTLKILDPDTNLWSLGIENIAIEAQSRKLRTQLPVMPDGSSSVDQKTTAIDNIKTEFYSEMFGLLLEQAQRNPIETINKNIQINMNVAANDIARKTRRGSGNFAITTYDVFKALRDEYPDNVKFIEGKSTCSNLTYHGTVGLIDIYCANFLKKNVILVGYSGGGKISRKNYDAGLFFSPYIKLLSVGPVFDITTGTPALSFLTRGKYTTIQPVDNLLTCTENYYRLLEVNLPTSQEEQ